MKKIITSIILLLVIALSLTSCHLIDEHITNSDPIHAQINALLESNQENYTIKASITNKSAHTVNETYDVTTAENGNKTISYTVERLNKFNVNDGVVTAPNSYKTVLTGYAVVNGENLFELEGDVLDIDFTKVVIPEFTFNDSTVENSVLDGDTLVADVKSQAEFLGVEFTTEPMQVEVVFSETSILTITLTFKTAGGNDVVVVYTFN